MGGLPQCAHAALKLCCLHLSERGRCSLSRASPLCVLVLFVLGASGTFCDSSLLGHTSSLRHSWTPGPSLLLGLTSLAPPLPWKPSRESPTRGQEPCPATLHPHYDHDRVAPRRQQTRRPPLLPAKAPQHPALLFPTFSLGKEGLRAAQRRRTWQIYCTARDYSHRRHRLWLWPPGVWQHWV